MSSSAEGGVVGGFPLPHHQGLQCHPGLLNHPRTHEYSLKPSLAASPNAPAPKAPASEPLDPEAPAP